MFSFHKNGQDAPVGRTCGSRPRLASLATGVLGPSWRRPTRGRPGRRQFFPCLPGELRPRPTEAPHCGLGQRRRELARSPSRSRDCPPARRASYRSPLAGRKRPSARHVHMRVVGAAGAALPSRSPSERSSPSKEGRKVGRVPKLSRSRTAGRGRAAASRGTARGRLGGPRRRTCTRSRASPRSRGRS